MTGRLRERAICEREKKYSVRGIVYIREKNYIERVSKILLV